MDVPKFTSDVAEYLLTGASERDAWMARQQSIQRQQNEWIMRRLIEGDVRFEVIERERRAQVAKAEKDRERDSGDIEDVSKRVGKFEKLQEKLSGVKLIVGGFFLVVVIPFLVTFLAEWLAGRANK